MCLLARRSSVLEMGMGGPRCLCWYELCVVFEWTINLIFLAVNCTKEDLDGLSNSRTDVTLLNYNDILTYGTTYKYEIIILRIQVNSTILRYECNEAGKSFEDPITGTFSKYYLVTCDADGSWNISSIPPCECKHNFKR